MIEHNIVLKRNAALRSYRIPECLLVPLKKEIEQILSLGIIEVSRNEWCNPIVLVPKKDSTIRFCIDFCYLNGISEFDSYPVPHIAELIDGLGKTKFLTTIDLCKGYWQMPLTMGHVSVQSHAFWNAWCHSYVPKTNRSGIVGIFCFCCCMIYLGDIVAHSATLEEHMDHLKAVIRHLHEAGLTVNSSKCQFAKSETEYLGYCTSLATR